MIFVIKGKIVEHTGQYDEKIIHRFFDRYPLMLAGCSIIPNSCVKRIFGSDEWYGRRNIDTPTLEPEDGNCWCDLCFGAGTFNI